MNYNTSSQILVLGMHRSGTSAIAGLLNMLGVYYAPADQIMPADEGNEKGYWERLDVYRTNQNVYWDLGLEWDRVSHFKLRCLTEKSHQIFNTHSNKIIQEMDRYRPWMLKDPRLCLLLPLWRPNLTCPICVCVYRDPMQIAHSLKKRNNLSLQVGLALWEKYTLQFLKDSTEIKRIAINYEDLVGNPVKVTHQFYRKLVELDVPGLTLPTDTKILSFISPKLFHNKTSHGLYSQYLNKQQYELSCLFKSGKILAQSDLPSLSKGAFEHLEDYERRYFLEQELTIEKAKSHESSNKFAIKATNELEKSNKLIELSRHTLDESISCLRQSSTEINNFGRLQNDILDNLRICKLHQDELINNENKQDDLVTTIKKETIEASKSLSTRIKEVENHHQDLLHSLSDNKSFGTQLKNIELSQQHTTEFLSQFERRQQLYFARELERVYMYLEELKKLDSYKKELENEKEKNTVLSRKIKTLKENIYKSNNKLDSLEIESNKTIATLNHKLSQLREQYNTKRTSETIKHKQVKLLLRWMDELSDAVPNLLKSYTWKIGRIIINTFFYIQFKKPKPGTWIRIYKIFNEFSRFRKNIGEPLTTGKTQLSIPIIKDTCNLTVDIIVCVHNALSDVEKCLDSIIKNTDHAYTLFIVNDGSDLKTTEYLTSFQKKNAHVRMYHNTEAKGYTTSANIGLKASSSDYAILLNSDTITPTGWLIPLLECGESDERIGIIGPLSNAASWQSIPLRFDTNGDWAINELPRGFDISQMSELVYQLSSKSFPKVAFINGFCFVIKKRVIDNIGYLNEKAFPYGYGEENDYCLRATSKGFHLAIADQAYIFHAKSKSYTHATRLKLSKQSSNTLKIIHSEERINKGIQELNGNKALNFIRQRVEQYLQGYLSNLILKTFPRILFIMPVRGGGGGAHSVIQEVAGMRALGIDAVISTQTRYREQFQKNYQRYYAKGTHFKFYTHDNEIKSFASSFHIVVATVYHTVKLLKEIANENPNILPGYYIQDYEPWFFDKGSEQWQIAYDSYTLIPNIIAFAKTEWLCDIVKQKHQLIVNKVAPSIDKDLFIPNTSRKANTFPVTVCAMIRPSTPRRAPVETLAILRNLKHKYKEKLFIILFGASDKELRTLQVPLDFEFENHGVLTRESVAELHRKADIFTDFSSYQAFGRTGLEAMSCGCTAILPINGGTHEYAKHEKNCLLVDTTSSSKMQLSLERLVTDHYFRSELQANAVQTAQDYSVSRACLSELSLLRNAWLKHQIKFHHKTSSTDTNNKCLSELRIAIIPVQIKPTPAGSCYIRLIRPLQHPKVSDKVTIVLNDVSSLHTSRANLVIVQRNALKKLSEVDKIIHYCEIHQSRLCLEIDDDLLHLHEKIDHIGLPREELDALNAIASNADQITVASKKLMELFSSINPNTIYIPNSLDEQIWLQKDAQNHFIFPQKKHTNDIKFLYMGTPTHTQDLLLIEEAWARIKDKYGDRASLDIVGGIDINATKLGNFHSLFNHVLAKGLEYHQFVAWLLSHNVWHIGLIPLASTKFNRNKSYIKYLDYAAMGLSIVCSDLEPYQDVVKNEMNGLLVSNDTNSWYIAIERLINDEQLRNNIAKNAFEDLCENHILQNTANNFFTSYQSLCVSETNELDPVAWTVDRPR